MSFDELKRRMRSGERAAALELEPLARAANDVDTVVMCWSVSQSPRFSAWKALDAAIGSAGWNDLSASLTEGGWDGESFQSTALIRADVIARALVSAAAVAPREEAPAARAMADIAELILDYSKIVDRMHYATAILDFTYQVQRVPLAEDLASMMEYLARARSRLDTVLADAYAKHK